jgi:acetoacetyl-CoA synthetase
MNRERAPLWTPSQDFMSGTRMQAYLDWLRKERGLSFASYEDCRRWSVAHLDEFWESIWDHFGILSHTPYDEVMVPAREGMIGTQWFTGSTVNYAEHIFRHRTNERPAILYSSERQPLQEVSWLELEQKVAAVSAWFRSKGVLKGDRVAAVMPNIPETVITFLAANAIGAIWSSCSPDFGEAGVADRFRQIDPKVLIHTDGYTYSGKAFDKRPALEALRRELPGLEQVVLLPFLDPAAQVAGTVAWNDLIATPHGTLNFEPLNFEHPLWVLFSSGTTGKPKAITHSVGGCLIEHLKSHALHQDVKPGDRYFWYSTTGWMMWNYAVASMLCGATLVIHEGAAGYPDLNRLWDLVAEAEVNHFGAGAAFHIACMKAGLDFGRDRFPHLRTVGSTGSPLPPDAFDWIYEHVGKDIWLISLSGGTDICGVFVGGCPFEPVYAGEIQCRVLGCDLEAYDDDGNPVRGALGEMVILQPMPSMPVFFWDDPGDKRYHASYFERYPGIWRHGDFIEITARGSVIIFGRSDATLNRDGVRIGTAEIYIVLDAIPEISDSLVVCAEEEGGTYFMPLFVVMKPGEELTDELRKAINWELRAQYSPRHVPDAIFDVTEIPYTISGKKMETPVKKILMGMDPDSVASRDTMRNPGALDGFVRYRRT